MSQSDRPPQAEKSCPIPAAHTRLRQCHELWHRTVAAYPDPDEFVLQLNTLIVTLRQVTFLLQKEKARIPGFDEWYGAWQERMRADPLMLWLHDARTHVEKRGDLDLASTAKVTVIASWLDGPSAEFSVPPLLGPEELATYGAVVELPEAIKKEGLLRVERRWVSSDLRGHELTEVCAHGYGVMATMIAEAHERLGFRMRTFSGEIHEGPRHYRTDHLGGRLPCMALTDDARTAYLHLASGELIELDATEVSFDPTKDREYFERAMEARMIGQGALPYDPEGDLIEMAASWSSVAKRVLAHDGYHRPMAFLFDEHNAPLSNIGLNFEDQAQKYLAVRQVAREVDRLGAVGLIVINEIWQAEMILKDMTEERFVRASERPDKTEALLVQVATYDGRDRRYTTSFTRNKKGQPVIGETEIEDGKRVHSPWLEPIREVWGSWPRSAADGEK